MITFQNNGGRLGENISFIYGLLRFAKINDVPRDNIYVDINYHNNTLLKNEKPEFVFRDNLKYFNNVKYIFKETIDTSNFKIIDLDGKYDLAQLYNFYKYTNYNINDNICFKNYWSLNLYWVNKDVYFDCNLLNDICRPNEIVKVLKFKYKNILNKSIAIHIRRGDYLALENKDILNDNSKSKYNYYFDKTKELYSENDLHELIRSIDKNLYENILIFSDDIEWCRDKFSCYKNTYFISNKPFEDMILMSLCNKVINNKGSFFSLVSKILCEYI